MPIPVTCECGSEFLTRDENAGRHAKCPDCGREFVVPTLTPMPPPDDVLVISSAPMVPVTNRKAVASLIVGSCFFCMAFTGIPAIILGCLALGEIRRGRVLFSGRWIAWTGIVLGIFSTLLTVAGGFHDGRDPARRAQCVNNLKQIGLAMHNYHETYNVFPPAAITDKQGRPLLSWRVAILPFLEQGELYAKFHLDEPWNSPHNLALIPERPNVYACPSNQALAIDQTNYQVIDDPRSMFTPDFMPVRMAGVTDGTSNTLLVGETLRTVPWTAPHDLRFNASIPQSGLGSDHSHHFGGFNALFADGSVKWLKPSIAPATFEALVTRNGNEVISAESY